MNEPLLLTVKQASEILGVNTRTVYRCHVADTNRQVVRYVISCLRHGWKTYRAMPREERRRLIRLAAERHAGNQDLYAAVVNGTL